MPRIFAKAYYSYGGPREHSRQLQDRASKFVNEVLSCASTGQLDRTSTISRPHSDTLAVTVALILVEGASKASNSSIRSSIRSYLYNFTKVQIRNQVQRCCERTAVFVYIVYHFLLWDQILISKVFGSTVPERVHQHEHGDEGHLADEPRLVQPTKLPPASLPPKWGVQVSSFWSRKTLNKKESFPTPNVTDSRNRKQWKVMVI